MKKGMEYCKWWLQQIIPSDNDAFLGVMAALLFIPMVLCALLFLPNLFTLDVFAPWVYACILLGTALVDMLTTSITTLPNKRRTYIFQTSWTMAMVFHSSRMAQEDLPALAALTATLVMLLMVFSNRLIDKNVYAMWTPPYSCNMPSSGPSSAFPYENMRSMCVLAIGFFLWWYSSDAPLLLPLTLVGLCTLHRIRLWRSLRTNVPLSMEQHTSIWPRKARRDGDVLLWGSMIMYNHVWREAIPYAALKKTCTQMDVDNLLVYFHNFSEQPERRLKCTKELTLVILERLKELDERAIVIFDMQSDDLSAAAQTLKDVRANKIAAAPKSWELPAL